MQGVQGQAVPLGELAQPAETARPGQRVPDCRRRRGVVRLRRWPVVGEGGGGVDAGQGAAPVGFGVGVVLAGEPVQVVAERAGGSGGAGRCAGGQGGVGGEDVGQDVEDAPSVQQEVVEGPDDLDLGRRTGGRWSAA